MRVNLMDLAGAAILMFILSRLTLWLTKWLGDNGTRILAAHAAALAAMTILAGLSWGDPGGDRFGWAFVTYGIPTVALCLIDLLALRARRARAARLTSPAPPTPPA